MLICNFCGYKYETFDGLDCSDEGFFCDECDCFTYFNHSKNKHQFKLFLEENGITKHQTDNIKFNKRLSPLRYPGGKSKLISVINQSLNPLNCETFVEAFAGGASVGLALLEAKVVQKFVINDIDFGVYSLFKTIQEAPFELINLIQKSEPTHEDFYIAKTKIQNNYLDCSLVEAAYALLITNRLAYSGIVKSGPMGGKDGTQKQLLCRWNPENLSRRILKIHTMSNNIMITNQDALQVIEDYYWLPNTTIFVDPPYYKQGQKLYSHFYQTEQHAALSCLIQSLTTGCPGADILMTYDKNPVIEELYWWTTPENIQRKYSI